MFESIAVIISEIVLSAYPLLIKLSPANLITQLFSRLGSFAVLSFIGILIFGKLSFNIPTLIGAGLLNLIHIQQSYEAFRKLSAGNAMAIFYTYPIWNLIATHLSEGLHIGIKDIFWMVIAFIGSIAVAKPEVSGKELGSGAINAFIAAITETLIYVFFRGDNSTEPFTGMFELYGGALAILGIPYLLGKTSAITSMPTMEWTKLFAFNSLIGFVGYALRFYMIPRISPVLFSSLSFFGILSAYIFDITIMGVKPTLVQMLGSLGIIIANVFLANPSMT